MVNIRLLSGIILNIIIFIYSQKKKKLTLDGSVTAFIVGSITLLASLDFYIILLTFFITSTKFTSLGSSRKKLISSTFKKEKKRDMYQVLANGGLPTLLCLIYLLYFQTYSKSACFDEKNGLKNSLIAMIVAYYAACNADTWSSEVGVLSQGNPLLITTFREVPRGTNGGISPLGTLMSICGGMLIGLVSGVQMLACNNANFIQMTLLGTISGFLGSLIDSILGALFQQTVYKLDTNQTVSKEEYCHSKHKTKYGIIGRDYLSNNMVNLIAAVIVSSSAGIFFYFI